MAPSRDLEPSALRFWAPALGMVSLLVVAASLILWTCLPVWAPQWVLENSPLVDPGVRALSDCIESGYVESLAFDRVDFESAWYLVPIDQEWPWVSAVHNDPLVLEPLLRAEDPHVRRTAAALAHDMLMGDASCLRLAEICLDSHDATIRSLAIDALYWSEAPRLVLHSLLNDPEPRIREIVMQSLQADLEARADLIVQRTVLDGLGSQHPDVRRGCAALALFAWEGGLSEAFLKTGFAPLVQSVGKDARTAHAATVVRDLDVGGQPWGLVLAAVLRADPPIRSLIARATAEAAQEELTDCLRTALDSPEPRLRAAAARVLSEIDGEPDLALVTRLARDPDPVIRALGIDWCREEDLIHGEDILTALRSKHLMIRRAGVRAFRTTAPLACWAEWRIEDDLDLTRQVLCRALAAVDDHQANELLRDFCEDPAPRIRDAARAARAARAAPK